MESLVQLEALCERLYNSQDSAERAHVESALKCFAEDTEYISQCQYILENASTPYALMLASSSLLKQVTEHSLPLQLRLDIRNYLIKYLATRGPDLKPFVVGSLIQLFCRVTKFGWLDDDKFKEVVKEATDFLNQVPHHYAVGLKILNQIVSEMNERNQGLSPAQHRRIAGAFRDSSLFEIFQISLTALFQVKNDAGSKLQELALLLSLKCLSFDFMGSPYDETSEDFGSIQVPSSWRPLFEDPSTLQIFFDFYAITRGHLSKEALECLVRLASVRRAVFTNEATRSKFLAHLMMGTKEILETGLGLADHDNYHVFCRLLGRFKVNYQLSELVGNEGYNDWIHLVAEFTLKSFQSWQWASSSIFYLLGLWSRLLSSVRFLKSDSPSRLEQYVPKLVESFISSRLVSLQSEVSDELSENHLDDVELLQDQLDFFPNLCRFQYESCSSYILNIMEPLLQIYMEVANLKACANINELSVIETKLAWMVHIISAIIKAKQITGISGESQQLHDAELSACVLQLINVTDSGLHSRRYGEISKQRLDHSILTFCQHLRKSYVGDQALLSSKFYARLSDIIGLHDHLSLLNAFVGKIAINLKSYESVELINHTLNLFLEITPGHMIGKLLLRLDNIKFMISHHSGEHFPFLKDYKHSRSRTTFYYAIGLLVFMEDSFLKFKSSMEPLLQVFISLESIPDANFRLDGPKYAFIGLMRDLRGITMATNSSRTFHFLFDWLYPAHMPLLLKGIVHWADTPEVMTPVLKFLAEFVLNKSQRLTFGSSSPNGILLFREVSKLIAAYGSRILSLPNRADMYAFKYKGIRISLAILTSALSGDYVNFGVFELYGDTTLVDALDIGLKMSLSIPLADILAFPKITRSYFTFLEVLLSKHLVFFLSQDTSTFLHIVGSLEAGIKGLNKNILSQCALAIDNLASFHFINTTMGESPSSPTAINLSQHIKDLPALFPQILKTLFELILFEDTDSHWSLSRAILSLILIGEEMFVRVKSLILASQRVDDQRHLSLCFDKLTENVNRSLDPKNRDKFSQNLTRFKKEYRAKQMGAASI